MAQTKNKRILTYHPAYSYSEEEVPCLVLGNKKIAKQYGWRVGDAVQIVYLLNGIFISKSPEKQK